MTVPETASEIADARLTGLLAEHVMGWRVAPDRFMMGSRGWKPVWRFQPTKRLEDAFSVLDAVGSDEYCIIGRGRVEFTVRVRIGKAVGISCDCSQARAIAQAVARALGLELEGCQPPNAEVERR